MFENTMTRVSPSFRKFLPAVSLLSSISLVTILFSVLSNKMIAVNMGAYGVGLMGLYRSLGSTVVGAFSLGYSTVFMQEISVDRSTKKRYETIAASITSSLIQMALLSILGILFCKQIAASLFGSNPSIEQIRDVTIVLFMAWINIGLQNIIAILRGNGSLSDFTKIQLINSVSTLILIIPLIKLGSLGLAINVASGSALALIWGSYRLYKSTELPAFSVLFKDGFHYLRRTGFPSIILTWQSVVTIGGFLLLQTLLQKNYGMEFLGNFAAAYLVIDTATNVLMSSVRSYFLPRFGELRNDEEKAELLMQMINLLLILATIGVVLICLLSPLVISILFSKRFTDAAPMLVILSLSLISAVFSWSYNTLLLHKGATSLFTFADTAWMTLLLVSIGASIRFGWHPYSSVILYSGCSAICVALYLGLTKWKTGNTFLPKPLSLRLLSVCITVAGASVLLFFKTRV